jgi:hypothetical protein
MLFLKLFIAALIFIAIIIGAIIVTYNAYLSIIKNDYVRPLDYSDFDDPDIHEDEWL